MHLEHVRFRFERRKKVQLKMKSVLARIVAITSVLSLVICGFILLNSQKNVQKKPACKEQVEHRLMLKSPIFTGRTCKSLNKDTIFSIMRHPSVPEIACETQARSQDFKRGVLFY